MTETTTPTPAQMRETRIAVEAAFDSWRRTLPDSAFSHSDGLRFYGLLDMVFGASALDAQGETTGEKLCAACNGWGESGLGFHQVCPVCSGEGAEPAAPPLAPSSEPPEFCYGAKDTGGHRAGREGDPMTTETRSCFLHGDYTGKERCPGCIHEIPPPMAFRDAFAAMATAAGDTDALERLDAAPPSREIAGVKDPPRCCVMCPPGQWEPSTTMRKGLPLCERHAAIEDAAAVPVQQEAIADATAPSEAGRQAREADLTDALARERHYIDTEAELRRQIEAREAEIRALIAKWRGFADEAARNGVPSALVKSMAIEACANHLESLLTPSQETA